MTSFSIGQPVRVGLVGTGFAAKLRAETIQGEPRAQLVGVAGHTPERTQEFGHIHQTQAFSVWQELVENSSLDLVMISGVNRDHGTIARAALQTGKHVIVEYPLSLQLQEAEELIALAKSKNLLLHVEHIERLGGVHQALLVSLPQVGTPLYARYATVTPQRPAPRKWTYQPELFGFPLAGALSRLHRLTHAFGEVATVSCQNRYWQLQDSDLQNSYYAGCLCAAQLRFRSGLIADVLYGKGEVAWQPERKLEVQGDRGSLVFDGDGGVLINAEGSQSIAVGERRGLFAKDTTAVLDHLLENTPLYVTAEASLYTLRVADAAQRSAETNQTIEL
ncbi:MAG: Gfo/Idh/MocA family oxidoreductase [Leptolyngbyaceae cyanobacterium CSU_1_3]|nr:Gfo/Idh/MocA family oxidoreductase [Leptolyngbyaceae cyanobacterium CSU_1_3]